MLSSLLTTLALRLTAPTWRRWPAAPHRLTLLRVHSTSSSATDSDSDSDSASVFTPNSSTESLVTVTSAATSTAPETPTETETALTLYLHLLWVAGLGSLRDIASGTWSVICPLASATFTAVRFLISASVTVYTTLSAAPTWPASAREYLFPSPPLPASLDVFTDIRATLPKAREYLPVVSARTYEKYLEDKERLEILMAKEVRCRIRLRYRLVVNPARRMATAVHEAVSGVKGRKAAKALARRDMLEARVIASLPAEDRPTAIGVFDSNRAGFFGMTSEDMFWHNELRKEHARPKPAPVVDYTHFNEWERVRREGANETLVPQGDEWDF